MSGTPEKTQDNKPEEHQNSTLKQQAPVTEDTLSQHALNEAELDSVAGGKPLMVGIGKTI